MRVISRFSINLGGNSSGELTTDSMPQAISTRIRGLFRTNKPTSTSKIPKSAIQRTSSQEGSNESGLEMSSLQQDNRSIESDLTITPVSRELIAMIQIGGTGLERQDISTGYVILEHLVQAIALDPR